ncbi:ABC transporter G family member 7 [Smittium culicis]|uniref:ABC transporter G family member 7 n=1 Tax=Smittium culicis TaxID=133412 RepID=A0A1R1XYG9_9FUNG|nr:ABC transporter G family member 7 [Smittium culicis]OMJ19737.1 ABC transporter G family member 7 [Smittium culicis]
MVAIIGGSGVGKTTLLNVLSGRILGGTLSGQVLFNGKKRDKKTFKKDVAYVEQDDVLFPTLTVKETISYAADFRLSNVDFNKHQKAERVRDVIKSLRLASVENSYIGDERNKGLSGGEKKRVSIGVEIVTQPRIFILDEPTSGLDSNSSLVIVNLMKEIALMENLICISSIHQPSSKVFYTFDKVILMAPTCIIYFGTTKDSLEYFSSIGYNCPPLENPADFLIDIISIDYENSNNFKNTLDRIERLKRAWDEYTRINGHIYIPRKDLFHSEISSTSRSAIPFLTKELYDSYELPSWRNSWYTEFSSLLKRSWVRQLRDKYALTSLFFSSFFTMFLLGFTFFNQTSGIFEITNKIGLIYLIAVNMAIPVAIPLISVLTQEMLVMTKERASGSYRMSAYFLSGILTVVPISLFSSFISLNGIYFLAKLQLSVYRYIIYILIYSSATLNSVGIAFVFSSVSSKEQVASIYTSLILTIFIIYGGSLVNIDTVPIGLSWIRHINYVYYTYIAAIQNEMTGLTFKCDKSTQQACFPTGEEVIRVFKLDELPISNCIIANFAMVIVLFLVSYLALRFKSRPNYILI